MPRRLNTVHAPPTSTTGLPARAVYRMVGSASAMTRRLVVGEVRPVNRRVRLRCPARPALAPSRRRRNGMGKRPVLDKIEMVDGPIDDKDYERELTKLQHRLLDLQVYHLRTGGRVIIGIDGWDAAGKGGLIERIVGGLEPKSTQVWRIGAPTPQDQGRHYLWRFWDRLPAPGNWAIFDRTWYGRVLVERIEG